MAATSWTPATPAPATVFSGRDGTPIDGGTIMDDTVVLMDSSSVTMDDLLIPRIFAPPTPWANLSQ